MDETKPENSHCLCFVRPGAISLLVFGAIKLSQFYKFISRRTSLTKQRNAKVVDTDLASCEKIAFTPDGQQESSSENNSFQKREKGDLLLQIVRPGNKPVPLPRATRVHQSISVAVTCRLFSADLSSPPSSLASPII